MTWSTEIEEISNNVYRLRMIHSSGASIEKVGLNLEHMKKEAKVDSKKMERDIDKKKYEN